MNLLNRKTLTTTVTIKWRLISRLQHNKHFLLVKAFRVTESYVASDQ